MGKIRSIVKNLRRRHDEPLNGRPTPGEGAMTLAAPDYNVEMVDHGRSKGLSQEAVDVSDLFTEKGAESAAKAAGKKPGKLTSKSTKKAYKQTRQQELRKYFKEQFQSDISLWLHTLYDKGDQKSGADERVLDEQQILLKRHFVAMAVLGLKAKQEDGSYRPFEHPEVPLAAIVSHGGRVAYEAIEGAGDSFHKLLMAGTRQDFEYDPSYGIIPGTGSRPHDAASRDKKPSRALAGLFRRMASHDQRINKSGEWEETKRYVGQGPRYLLNSIRETKSTSLGMNFPMGGFGNTSSEAQTRIGPEGAILSEQGKAVGQHGHAFFMYGEEGDKARLMVGVEGSGPYQTSLTGKHGPLSIFGGGNSRSATGQSKAVTLGLPSGEGALKADVDSGSLKLVEKAFESLGQIEWAGSSEHVRQEKRIFEQLLASTDSVERRRLIGLLNELAADIRKKEGPETLV